MYKLLGSEDYIHDSGKALSPLSLISSGPICLSELGTSPNVGFTAASLISVDLYLYMYLSQVNEYLFTSTRTVIRVWHKYPYWEATEKALPTSSTHLLSPLLHLRSLSPAIGTTERLGLLEKIPLGSLNDAPSKIDTQFLKA